MLFLRLRRRRFAGFLIASGFAGFLVALGSLLLDWHFIPSAARADGRIVQMLERKSDVVVVFAPVFSFQDGRSGQHTIYSASTSYPPEHQMGDLVGVLFLVEDPRHANIHSFFSLWAVAFISGLIATFYLPVGAVTWFWPRLVRVFRRDGTNSTAT